VAVGAGLALRMQGTDHVVISFFGDGASNRGDFHEALNLASVLKVPVVFVCENNGYAQTVPASTAMALKDIADRAAGYGMPGLVIDGQDVEAVYQATQSAIQRARTGVGPTLLECKTNRFRVHHPFFEEDRSPDEVARCWERDPIEILGARLKEKGWLGQADIERMEQQIRQELEEAIREAEAVPTPTPEEVFTQIYAESLGEMGL
jgi:pyruvate dehydrogenase E1 component alpha subunit